ncbi:unnamed protein product [Diamesa serratosioi]
MENVKLQSATVCDLCGKSFSNIYTMTAHHRQIHEGIKEFHCQLCQKSFTTKYKLSRHHAGIHSNVRDFICNSCGNQFKTRDMLIKHERTHFQGLGPFVCENCSEEFKYKSGLDYHYKIKHTQKPVTASKAKKEDKKVKQFSCEACDKIFNTNSRYKRHMFMHSERLFSCDICNKSFKSTYDVVKHRKSHVGSYFTCPICSKKYKDRQNFAIHITSHELGNTAGGFEELDDENIISTFTEMETEPQDVIFKQVDEELVSITKIETKRLINETSQIDETVNLENDVETVYEYLLDEDGISNIAEDYHRKDDFEECMCIQCETWFDRKNDLDVHVNLCGKIIEIKPATSQERKETCQSKICDVCGNISKTSGDLKKHFMRKHLKKYQFSCDHCPKKFLLSYDLKRHMVKHSSSRDFKCDLCDSKFKMKASLNNHIKTIHASDVTSEKNFQCTVCDRSYKHQRHLEYHLRTHSNDRRYACNRCDQKFFYSDAVKWHFIRFHGDQSPYQCTICEKKFIHEKALVSHLKQHEVGLAVVCPICKKQISEKRHLKRHLRTHDDLKHHRCKFCDGEFKERHQLTK